MKYQPQNDLIDPDISADAPGFDGPANDDPDAPNDAYVIGQHGRTVQAPDGRRRAGARYGPKPWVPALAFALAAACVALTVWNVNRFLAGPPPPPKPSAFQVKQALYLGVMKIDAYRHVHGVTPQSLTDASLPAVGPYRYERIDPAHYALSFQIDGAKVEYDSSMSKEQFFGTPQAILTMGGSQ